MQVYIFLPGIRYYYYLLFISYYYYYYYYNHSGNNFWIKIIGQNKIFLLKCSRSDHMSNWRERYFILDGNHINYYKSKNDDAVRGSFKITESTKVMKTYNFTRKYTFTTIDEGQVDLLMQGSNESEMNEWVSCIQASIDRCKMLESGVHKKSVMVEVELPEGVLLHGWCYYCDHSGVVKGVWYKYYFTLWENSSLYFFSNLENAQNFFMGKPSVRKLEGKHHIELLLFNHLEILLFNHLNIIII